MSTLTPSQPDIVIGTGDFDLLSRLASSGLDAAEILQSELERARVVEPDDLPRNVVRLNSTVGYTVDGRSPTTVTVVMPEDADIARGRISVLTPIGAALIGLSPGQSISWETRDGHERTLTVITVFAASGTPASAQAAGADTSAGDWSDDPGPSAA